MIITHMINMPYDGTLNTESYSAMRQEVCEARGGEAAQDKMKGRPAGGGTVDGQFMDTGDQVEPTRAPAGRGRPNPVDVHVGSRLRQRRTLMGMSQEKLADAIGLTFQQVQKYERGANRIGASRLHQLARVLDVPVSYFFEDLAPNRPPVDGAAQQGFAEDPPPFEHDPMSRRETLELVRAYYRIPDEKVRKRVFELVKSIAGQARGENE